MAFRHKNQVQLSSHFWELVSKDFSAMECSVCRVAISKPYQESFLLWAANYLFQGGQDSPRGAKNFFREMFVEIRPFKQILYCDTLAWKPPSDNYYRCGQQLYQPHSSHWKVWWYAPLLGSPPHGYVSVRPYVWLEMLQLSTTDMLWSMWSHCSNNCSAGSFRPTPISVLDWSQREKSSLSTTSKPTCLFSKENHNVLVCRKSHWNQLCASASWLAR